MKVSLIAEPYDLGRERVGMGAGPIAYLEAGTADSLSEQGFEVEVETVERRETFEDEPSATADINERLAEHVERAVSRGAFPLVLGGNCDSSLGTLAGVGSAEMGVIWFDAHGDFDTPRTSTDGYLGGMSLAIATGNCHEELWSRVGNDAPVPESRVVMVGTRDVAPEQRPLLDNSRVTAVEAQSERSEGSETSLREPLDRLGSQVSDVYLHLDIDSLDPQHAPGVDFPAPGGLSVENVEDAIRMIARGFRIRAAALTAYNPDKDKESKTLQSGTRLLSTVAEAVARSRTKERRGR